MKRKRKEIVQYNYISQNQNDQFMGLGDMTIEEMLAGLEIPETEQKITNPFSGESVWLVPEAAALYDFVKGIEGMLQMIPENHPFQKSLSKAFSKVLLHFRKEWPEQYAALLD